MDESIFSTWNILKFGFTLVIFTVAWSFANQMVDAKFIDQDVVDLQCQELFNDSNAFGKVKNGFIQHQFCVTSDGIAHAITIDTIEDKIYKIDEVKK